MRRRMNISPHAPATARSAHGHPDSPASSKHASSSKGRLRFMPPNSVLARCLARRIGRASASCPSASSSGAIGLSACMTGSFSIAIRQPPPGARNVSIPESGMASVEQTTQEQAQSHDRLMRRATLAAVAVAVLLITLKGAVFWFTGSVAMLGTLTDSLLDGAASLLNLFAVRASLAPPDAEHRFGHGKAEALAGLGQSVFIFASAGYIVLEAIKIGRAHV